MGLLEYLAVIVIFWAVVDIIYEFGRKFFEERGLKIYYGFVLVYKKTTGFKTLGRARKYTYIHIPLFIIALFFFYQAMIASILIRFGILRGVPAKLLIPGINITGMQLVYFVITVGIAATVHELMHAHTALAHGLRVKSIGFALLFILPIAFTEVDEEQLVEAPLRTKVAILSAGPSANMILALISLALLAVIVAPYGIVVLDILPHSLADTYGLHSGDIILAINGEPLTRHVLAKYLNNRTDLNLTLTIIRDHTVENVTVFKPANTTRLGIRFADKPSDYLINAIGLNASLSILFITIWCYLVNLGLAVINAAPLFVSDGGRILYELFKNKNIGHTINAVSLLIFVLAVLPIR
jgi:membrane-associated protease RseP (regulator of RpoE activity)